MLYDPEEEQYLRGRENIFEFMGWRFVLRIHEDPTRMDRIQILTCHKRLLNPESPNMVHSYASGSIHTPPQYLAAWLIAHWWEHALLMCPCLHGKNDEEGTQFRSTMIESLLWYEAHL